MGSPIVFFLLNKPVVIAEGRRRSIGVLDAQLDLPYILFKRTSNASLDNELFLLQVFHSVEGITADSVFPASTRPRLLVTLVKHFALDSVPFVSLR